MKQQKIYKIKKHVKEYEGAYKCYQSKSNTT